VPLETVARDAGVGIGTLYRHFPTREALVEAVYHDQLARLCDSADDLVARLPADLALRTWMTRYAEFVTTKRGMAEALRQVIATGAITSSQTRQRLDAAIQTMLDAGDAAGLLRSDVPAGDVSAGLAGILLTAGVSGGGDQTDRLLDLLLDGLSPRPPAPGGAPR
jgi:AcrR family transcriptional regulator